MRKLWVSLGILSLLLSGCGSAGPKKLVQLECSLKDGDETQGMMEVKGIFKYDKDTDLIQTQKQTSIIVAPDKETYDLLVQTFKDADQRNGYSKIKGMKYLLDFDEDSLAIKEDMDIVMENITGDDYYIISNQEVDTQGQSTVKLSASQTREGLEQSGFACEISE